MAAMGCMRIIPTAAQEVILGLLPLHLFVKQDAAATAIRLMKLNLWRSARVPHTEIVCEAIGKEPLIEVVTHRVPQQFV